MRPMSVIRALVGGLFGAILGALLWGLWGPEWFGFPGDPGLGAVLGALLLGWLFVRFRVSLATVLEALGSVFD